MKLLKKVKNGLIGIGAFLLNLPSKVLAVEIVAPMYGIPAPEPINTIGNQIWNICKFLIIPIALLIGLIVYFKKSKSPIKRKIFITIIIVLLVAVIYIVGNVIVINSL